MNKLKRIIATLMICLLLVGGIGLQFLNNNSQTEEKNVIVSDGEDPNQDPDPIKS